MDKQTLSQYGWITVMVLTLSIMLAFATPLGKYVGRGVSNIAIAMGIANDNAVKEDNIKEMEDKWEDFINEADKNADNPPNDDEPDTTPELNDKGFYYDVVYYGELRDDGSDYGHSYVKDYAVVFYENGTALIFEDTTAPITVLHQDNVTYTVSGNQISIPSSAVTLTISPDGKSMEHSEAFGVYFGSISMRTDIPVTGVQYETVYTEAWNSDITLVFHSNGTVTYTDENGNTTIKNIISWSSLYRCSVEGLGTIKLALFENKVSFAIET